MDDFLKGLLAVCPQTSLSLEYIAEVIGLPPTQPTPSSLCLNASHRD